MRASYLNTLYTVSLYALNSIREYAGLRTTRDLPSFIVPSTAVPTSLFYRGHPPYTTVRGSAAAKAAAVQRQQRSERRTRLAAAEEEISKLQCMPSIATSALRKLISNTDQLRQFASHPSKLGLGQRNEVDCFVPMPSPRSAASAAPGGGTLPPSEWRGDQKSQCKRRRRDC